MTDSQRRHQGVAPMRPCIHNCPNGWHSLHLRVTCRVSLSHRFLPQSLWPCCSPTLWNTHLSTSFEVPRLLSWFLALRTQVITVALGHRGDSLSTLHLHTQILSPSLQLFQNLLVFLPIPKDKLLLRIPDWSGTGSVDQAGLNLQRSIYLSVSIA